MISVILTVYARPQNLDLQLEAINNQSIKPKEIIIVLDKNINVDFDIKKYEQYQIVSFNKNIGVCGRFSVALLTSQPYICVFDDDTIPGNKWFENCLNTYKKVDGLLGTVGVLFNKGSLDYDYSKRIGWPDPNESIEEVDIVGHSWFFKRKHIEHFWQKTSNHSEFKKSGEDIHFSYILKKTLDLNTYVPPHPVNDKSLWGSIKEYSMLIGTDENAISFNSQHQKAMSAALRGYIDKGFKLKYLSDLKYKKILLKAKKNIKKLL